LEDHPDDERGMKFSRGERNMNRQDENYPGDDHDYQSFCICQYRGLTCIKINQQKCTYGYYGERADKGGEQAL